MKKFLLSSVAVATMMSASAFAADLPSRAPPIAPSFTSPAPVYSWTGFYAGVHAGYSFGSTSFRVIEAGTPSATASPNGFVGGALVGFNYQINQAVLGLEADVGFGSISGSANAGGAGGFSHGNRFREDWNGRIRARVGFAAGNFMPFIAAGYSFGNDKLTVVSGAAASSVSKSLSGWNIGAGVDFQIANNWVGRVEYIYDQFNAMTYVPGGGFNNRATGRPDVSTIRAALIYTFGGTSSSTVAARY